MGMQSLLVKYSLFILIGCFPLLSFSADDNKIAHPDYNKAFLVPCKNGQCPSGSSCSSDNMCHADSSNKEKDKAPSNADLCVQQYEALVAQCRSEVQAATYRCDEKSDSAMSNIGDMASQLALMAGQSTANSVKDSCSKMAGITQGANAALAAYRLACKSAISDCDSSCSKVKDYLTENAHCMEGGVVTLAKSSAVTGLMSEVEDEIDRCNSLDSKVEQANQAIQNYAKIMANARNCDVKNTGTPTPEVVTPPICLTQPNSPACKMATKIIDCSSPELAATNKVCICIKNPSDPSCRMAQKFGGDDGPGMMVDPSGRLSGKGDGSDFSGDIPNLPSIAQREINKAAGSSINGKQGGNAALGGGSNGSGGGGATAGGNGGSDSSTDPSSGGSGFYGGGGGSGSGRGYSDGDGEPSSSGSRGLRPAAVGANGKPLSPNLRKFLPGGQYDPRRGFSGMAGPDGITGPHSDIWQKIQNRYRVMSPFLLP